MDFQDTQSPYDLERANGGTLMGFVAFGPKIDPVEKLQQLVHRPLDTSGTLPEDPFYEVNNKLDRWEQQMVGKYQRFMPIAVAMAQMSKMNGTKVGAVILGVDYQILASGWNGAPRRSNADVDHRNDTRESRLNWVCHAEANAIANAARSGTALSGGTMVCTLMPCMTCAKLMVQAGISRVICPDPGHNLQWGEEFKLASDLFKECGIRVHYIDKVAQ